MVATVRPNLNSVALVTEEFDGATASTGYCVLRPALKKLHPKYLYYWVRTGHFVNEMTRMSTGANYPAVNDRVIKNSKIPFSNFIEQERIAAILDKSDAICRKRQQAIQLADEFLRSVFLDMFGDPIANPNNWEVHRMGDVIEFKGGSQPPKSVFINAPMEGYTRLIQIRDFKSNKFPAYIPNELVRRRFETDDVMIARYGPPVFQILRGLEGAYNVALMKAIPKGEITKDFIFYLLQLPAYHGRVVAASERTAGQTGVNLDLLNNFDLPLPPIKFQKEIIARLSCMENIIKKKRKSSSCLNNLFCGLSQKAFSGKL